MILMDFGDFMKIMKSRSAIMTGIPIWSYAKCCNVRSSKTYENRCDDERTRLRKSDITFAVMFRTAVAKVITFACFPCAELLEHNVMVDRHPQHSRPNDFALEEVRGRG